jgi:Sortase domain
VVAGLSGPDGPPRPAAVSSPVPSAVPSSPVPSRPPAPASAAPAAPVPATDLTITSLPRARPISLSIPSIGVQSRDLVDLATEADGSLEVPTDFAQPGWYSPGAAPGQLGPAVLAGHVDSRRGPAVFYRLGELRPGARVEVGREDGTTARFVVDKVERYPKDEFPTVAVYSDTTHRAELRLITCGGAFDDATGHYVDNVVAYAHLV